MADWDYLVYIPLSFAGMQIYLLLCVGWRGLAAERPCPFFFFNFIQAHPLSFHLQEERDERKLLWRHRRDIRMAAPYSLIIQRPSAYPAGKSVQNPFCILQAQHLEPASDSWFSKYTPLQVSPLAIYGFYPWGEYGSDMSESSFLGWRRWCFTIYIWSRR